LSGQFTETAGGRVVPGWIGPPMVEACSRSGAFVSMFFSMSETDGPPKLHPAPVTAATAMVEIQRDGACRRYG
jgi:hypothetical protein